MEKNESAKAKIFAVVVSLVGIVIAGLSAWFAWMQADISRTQNRLSVKPILQITPYLEGANKRNGLYLSNDGLGPAILTSYAVTVNGKQFSGFRGDFWPEILSSVNIDVHCFATGWPKGITTLKAGVEVPVVILSGSAASKEKCAREMVKLVGGVADFVIHIEYESIYEDKQVLNADPKITSSVLAKLYRDMSAIDMDRP